MCQTNSQQNTLRRQIGLPRCAERRAGKKPSRVDSGLYFAQFCSSSSTSVILWASSGVQNLTSIRNPARGRGCPMYCWPWNFHPNPPATFLSYLARRQRLEQSHYPVRHTLLRSADNKIIMVVPKESRLSTSDLEWVVNFLARDATQSVLLANCLCPVHYVDTA